MTTVLDKPAESEKLRLSLFNQFWENHITPKTVLRRSSEI